MPLEKTGDAPTAGDLVNRSVHYIPAAVAERQLVGDLADQRIRRVEVRQTVVGRRLTNLHASPANFLSDNPHFCRSALSGYTQRDFIALVERYGIAYHEKTRGQLFCDGSSQQIIDMLLAECRNAHAQLRLGVRISAIRKRRKRLCRCRPIRANFAAGRWWSRPAGPRFRKWDRADSATRSPSNSASKIVPPRPALVPLDVRRGVAGAI